MKFSVSDLLDQLRGDAVLPLTNLEKKLALKTAVEKAQLELALQALAKVGVIASAEEGISRASNDAIFEARVRSSSKGFCFALREDGGEDVYLRDHQLNHAWNGDRVLVKVTREGGRRRSPEGVVQCILERANTTVLAQVERQAEQLVAVPLDDRLHAAIQLPETDLARLRRRGSQKFRLGSFLSIIPLKMAGFFIALSLFRRQVSPLLPSRESAESLPYPKCHRERVWRCGPSQ